MKLLFDQNLSFKLCVQLSDLFPRSAQVRLLGLDGAEERVIWEQAKAEDFVLVSQDSDFAELATAFGPPPKIIWLRCGNQPTATIATLLRENAEFVLAFAQESGNLWALSPARPKK